LYDLDRQKYCEICIKAKKAKCEGCEYEQPKLTGEAADVFDVFYRCQTQWRSGGFGVIGLDYSVVFKVADVCGVSITPAFVRYINACEQVALERINNAENRSSNSRIGEGYNTTSV